MRYILWSGGFDSTYLLCKRARESDERIQPVYAIFHQDRVAQERKAQAEILPLIRTKETCIAPINDPIEFAYESLSAPEGFEEAYEKWKGKIPSGLMNMAGRLSKEFPGIEMGIEGPAPGRRPNDIGRVYAFLTDNGLQLDEDGKIVAGVGDEDLLKIFGNIGFPIIRINTVDEWNGYVSWGWEDIALKTRFCYSKEDETCGVCRACEVKWSYGDTFSFLFSKSGKKNHEIKTWLNKNKPELSDYFTEYARNGYWLNLLDENRMLNSQKSRVLTKYFDELEDKYPNLEEVDAPVY